MPDAFQFSKSRTFFRLFTAVALLSLLWHSHRSAQAEPAPIIEVGDVSTTASNVYIHVGKVGLGHEHAVAGQIKSGTIRLGAKKKAGEIVFDMTTFVADRIEARSYIGLRGTSSDSMQKEVTDNMQGPHVLDVQKHPTAKFKIDSAQHAQEKSKDGSRKYRLTGEFTLHGVTQPLEFDAVAHEEKTGIRLRGNFKILQTKFGIQPFSKAFGTIGVADELSIYGEILLTKPDSTTAERLYDAPRKPVR